MTSDIQAWRDRRTVDVPPIAQGVRLSESQIGAVMARESDRILAQFIRDGDMDGVMLDDGFYVKDEDLVQNFVTTFNPVDILYAPAPRQVVQSILYRLSAPIKEFIGAFRKSGQIVAMRHIKTIVNQDTMRYGSYFLEIHFKYAAFKRYRP